MKDQPGVGRAPQIHAQLPRGVKHSLYLGDVVAAYELLGRGLLELAQELSPLSVGVHERGRILYPGLRGGSREHVLARRSPEQARLRGWRLRSEEHTSELQSRQYLVCRLLLEKKNKLNYTSRLL